MDPNQNMPVATPATAFFCPTCSSADVISSSLAGGNASCNVCTWKGRSEELVAFHFQHDTGSQEGVYRAFFMDIRQLLARRLAAEILPLLMRWGFMSSPADPKLLARYLAAVARGIADGIVQARSDIEKEKHGQHAGS